MTVFWTIATFVFTFAVLAVVAFGLIRLFTRHLEEHNPDAPTVDVGWRAWS